MADAERLRANLAELERLHEAGSLTEQQLEVARRVLAERAAREVPEATPRPLTPSLPAPGSARDWLIPRGPVEIALAYVLAVFALTAVAVLGRHFASRQVEPAELDPATLVPAPLPRFELAEPAPSDDGNLTPSEIAGLVARDQRGAEDSPESYFLRGFKQTARRARADKAVYLVIVHPEPKLVLSKVNGQRTGPVVLGFTTVMSASSATRDEQRRLIEILITRGPVSVQITFDDARPFEGGAELMAISVAAELAQMPTTPCLAVGWCRAETIAILFLFSFPMGGLALAWEGARRRRLGIGLPITVAGLVGVIQRARVARRVRHRAADVVLFENEMVLARAPFASYEIIVGFMFASILGAFAAQRHVVRREATRRNAIAQLPPAEIVAAHKSNRLVPYDRIERVEARTRRRSGQARIWLTDGTRLRFSWSSTFNRRNDVPLLLTSALGDRVDVRRQKFRVLRLVLAVVILVVVGFVGIVIAGVLLGT